MYDFSWKIYLGICIFILAKRDFPTFADETHLPTEDTAPKDISLDLSSDTWQKNRNHSQFLDSKPLLDFKESQKFSRHLFRMKRSIFFPTGIKVCPEESIEQATANHLKYFKLRVCQEAIWEAFKIFLDRLPGQEEYQKWLNECEAGTVNIFEMGTNFSQSEEYQSLIAKKLSYTKETMDGMPTPSPVGDTTTLRGIVASIPPPDVVSTDSHLDRTEKTEDHEVSNEITRDYTKLMKPGHEQLVVFSILLPEEKYINELSDPSTEEYQQLSQQFISEIQNAYEGLPGFKNIHVTEFRSTQDNRVEVLYAVVFDREAMSNVIWDWINLQPNKVEQNSFAEIKDNSTVVYTDSDFRHYIAEILHKNILFENASLSLDPGSLQLINVKEVAVSMTEITSWITAKPIDDDHAIVSEWPSAAQSTASSILPFDLPGPDLIFDSDNNVWMKPDGFVDSESVLNSKTDITISPEDLLFMDEKQKIHTGTPLFFETDSHIDLESHSNLSLLDIGLEKEKELEGLLVPSTVLPHIVPKEILPTSDSAIPLSLTSPTASVLAIEPSTEEELSTVFSKEETQQSSINKEKDTIEYYGSGSGQQPQVNLETWLKTEGSGMHDYNETYFTPDSPKEDIIQDILDATISQSSLDTEVTSDERIVTSTEIYSTIKLEPSTEDEIISEITAIYDVILTEEPSKNQSHTTITIKELEKPEIILSAYSTVESPVIQSPELEKDLVTEELEVTDQAYEVTTYYYHEKEGIMIDSHVELPTNAHSTEMVGISRITPENPNNVTIPARALVVFFSLRVTNMIFSEDLFNKNSPEYKALEQRFLELLVPYLQSNLTGFQNLEILNFRNGSIVVNSRMKFVRPVPRNVTNSVYMILEDFCNTAYQTMNLAIDKYSLDVESGVQADPCKFQACNEFSECLVNQWSGEAECVCYPGYLSINGLPCNSICLLQRNFCQNDGKCDIIPGQGAICRCRVGENWWYRGERCEEYVSEPLVVGIAIASVAVFLLIACTVTFFLARTLRDQNTKSEIEDSFVQGDSLSSIEYAVKYNPMYESDTTGYSHYYRRCPQLTSYSSTSNETSTEYSSEEIKHIYDNRELSKEDIQDRIRIIELYAKDHQFADFVKRHQM
ncbi:interphotoreceptor matrix proteoglycan 2 [Pantherophis guttatus]|uniref:Interphotoreceptor matrix proteoglycan 2 n=1 Tax=Pantherophis guttatus TaxID=94885 RepID=A0A6P9BH62_PANGU|nr:interphotoreceptor matrix proteoglycan 2 [Pantherophis guttatus]